MEGVYYSGCLMFFGWEIFFVKYEIADMNSRTYLYIICFAYLKSNYITRYSKV
jgi:hypothetical protein